MTILSWLNLFSFPFKVLGKSFANGTQRIDEDVEKKKKNVQITNMKSSEEWHKSIAESTYIRAWKLFSCSLVLCIHIESCGNGIFPLATRAPS